MLPHHHILLGISFIFLIWILFPSIDLLPLVILFLSSVLIDVDHYFTYVYRKKDFSLKNAYNWYLDLRKLYIREVKKNPKLKMPLNMFHTIEFLILVVLLSIYSKYVFLILISFLFHSIMDIIEMASKDLLCAREFSLINYAFSNKKNYLN